MRCALKHVHPTSKPPQAAVIALTILLLLVTTTRPVFACKCGELSEADLATKVVFAGTAVEYLERQPDHSRSVDDEYNAATRLVVEFSADLPIGESVIVMGRHDSDCNPWFAVGGRSLVVAARMGEFLTSSKCLQMLDGGQAAKVRERVRLPADYFAFDVTPRPPPPDRCLQPATVDAAFAAADAVGFSTPRAACVVPGTDEVEQASAMKWAWKGAVRGDVLRARVKGRPELSYEDFDFFGELIEATHGRWPPAEFLRREGELLINDGCLNPRPPRSVAAGAEAMRRLFPLPADYGRWLPPGDDPLPRLSCSTLDQALFDRGDAAVADYRRRHQQASPRPATVETPVRNGSCAGCALSYPDDARPSVVVLALLGAFLGAFLGARRARLRRRRRRVAEGPTRAGLF